jgi:hypothetical protein
MFAIRNCKWRQALPATQPISQGSHRRGECLNVSMTHNRDSCGQSRRVRQINPTGSIRTDNW